MRVRLLGGLVLAIGLALGGMACGGGADLDAEEEVVFEVTGGDPATSAEMTGVIGPSTPQRLRELLEDHPGIDTIVMLDVPGSDDDESNLEAARLVRSAGLGTHVPSDGRIASGGVDFYLAGVKRTRERGAEFGVHSWASGDGRTGAEISGDDPQHDLYLDYYDEMAVDPDFYWFTLDAAPAESIHVMAEDELVRYGFGSVID